MYKIFTKDDLKHMNKFFQDMTPEQARILEAKTDYESSKDLED